MGMVAGLTGSAFLEWIVTGHASSAGTQDGVEDWLGASVSIVEVFGEQFPLNLDCDLALAFLKGDFFGLDWGKDCSEQKKEEGLFHFLASLGLDSDSWKNSVSADSLLPEPSWINNPRLSSPVASK